MARISLRDFFKNPDRSAYRIAPDGSSISYLAPYESRLNIHVKILATGETRRVTNERDRDIRNYFWKNNDTICYLLDTGGDENEHLFLVPVKEPVVRDMTPFPGVKVEIIDILPDNPTTMLIGMNRRNPELFDVYRMNVSTGELTCVAENPGGVTDWLADHAGCLRLAIANDGVNVAMLYRESEEREFSIVCTLNYKQTLHPLIFTFDNTQIIAASNLDRDTMAIVTFDPATARESSVLFEYPGADVSGLDFSRKRKLITTAMYTTWKTEYAFFDGETRTMFQDLERRLPGKEIIIADKTLDEKTFIVRTHSDCSLGAYYLYTPELNVFESLAEVSPWLHERDLAEMKPVSYQSRDGLTIHGYLTVPTGEPAANLPVVLYIHGGPWVRDVWQFNPVVQFFANRGYAVLQVNYRGSTGYGKRFKEAGYKQWGQAMQNDMSDGVLWLIKEGVADPKRIAIFGGSYGGYATLAGMTFTPELYACGVDYCGVSNLFTFLETIPPYWKPMLEMMYDMVGHPDSDKEMLRRASPVFHVANIRAPLFIAQGANDPRVKKSESDQMVEALERRGIAVQYMVKENEGHGFHNEENKFDLYEAMEKFLAQHIG